MRDLPLSSPEIQTPLRAESWQYNPELEKLDRHPELLDGLPPGERGQLRQSLAYYRAGRDAARSVGRSTGAPS